MTDHGTTLSVGQFAEFSANVTRNLPRDMDTVILNYWNSHGQKLKEVLVDNLQQVPEDLFEPLQGLYSSDGWTYLDGMMRRGGPSVSILSVLKERKIQWSEGIGNLVRQEDFYPRPKLKLMETSPKDLGFSGHVHLDDLRKKAFGYGLLELDLVELIQARVLYCHQTKDSLPVFVFGKGPGLYFVSRMGLLDGSYRQYHQTLTLIEDSSQELPDYSRLLFKKA